MKLFRIICQKSLALFLFLGMFLFFLNIGVSSAHADIVISEMEDKSTGEDVSTTVRFTVSGDFLDDLTITADSDNDNVVPDENIVHTGSGTSHSITIVPALNKSGQAKITVKAGNGVSSDTESFMLTVIPRNDAPTVSLPSVQSMDENTELVFSGANENRITIADPDAGDNSIEATVSVTNGILKIEGTASSTLKDNGTTKIYFKGSLSKINNDMSGMKYIPAQNWNGDEILTVKVDDMGHSGGADNPFASTLTGSGKMTITVNAVNDPPVVTVPEAQTALEDEALIFSLENANLISITDTDSGEEVIQVKAGLDKGLVTVVSDSGAQVTGSSTPQVTIKGTLTQVNEALQGLKCRMGKASLGGDVMGSSSYSLEKEWSGKAVLTVTADDLGNTGSGGAKSDTKTVDINVLPVNDPPYVTAPESETINEDTTFEFSGISISDADIGDGNLNVSFSVAHGTLSIMEGAELSLKKEGANYILTGTLSKINTALTELIYTPLENWSGDDLITMTANDLGNTGGDPNEESAEITIIVKALNDAPVLDNTSKVILTPVKKNEQNSDGDRVENILKNRVADADNEETAAGIAVVSADNTNGLWQYFVYGGEWTVFPDDISESSAVLLNKDTRIRFVPNIDWAGKANLSFRVWDGSDENDNGDSGIDTTINGGSSAFSELIGTAYVIAGEPEFIIANAGMDREVVSGKKVSLDASGSTILDDLDVIYLWEQTGGEEVELSGTAVPGPEFKAPVTESNNLELTFKLTLKDETGRESSDTVKITVKPAEKVQINAGEDQKVTEGDLVNLDGSESIIPADIEVSWLWEQTEGTDVTLSNESSKRPTFTAPEVELHGETLTFKLTLTEIKQDEEDQETEEAEETPAEAKTYTDTVSILVKDRNSVTANAGQDQEVNEGSEVTLDASGSVIPEVADITYLWEQTTGIDVVLSDAGAEKPTFTAPDVGSEGAELTFTLTVKNTVGEDSIQDSDTVIIRVKDPNVVIANAGEDQTVTEGKEVTLDGSGSTIPGGVEASFFWELTEGTEVALSGGETDKPTFTAPEVEDEGTELVFTLTLTKTEGEEVTESSDTVTIYVKDRDAVIADAGDDKTVKPGETVTLNGSASVVPEDVAPLYKWEQISEGDAVELSNPEAVETTFIAPDVEEGQEKVLTFKFTVSDNAEKSDEDTVNVTIRNEIVSTLPVANAGADINASGGNLVTLDGSASYDPGGEIIQYLWEELSGYSIALSAPDDSVTTFTAPQGGENGKILEFRLTVRDKDDNTNQDVVKVNIMSDSGTPPTPPAQGNTFNEGQTVTLSISDTGDLGPIVSYKWEQTFGPGVEMSDVNSPTPTFVAPSVGAEGVTLVFKVTLTDENGNSNATSISIGVKDNGIASFGEGVLAFKPTTSTTMGIKTDGRLVKLEAIDPAKITDQKNRPGSLIYGLISMDIKVNNPGDTAYVTIFLEKAAEAGYKWYKYSYTDGWSDYSSHAVFSADRKQVVLTFVDGGIGDEDKTANGIIKDPSGLGKIAATPGDDGNDGNDDTPDDGNSGSDGDKSGPGEDDDSCFIKTIGF